MKVICIIILFLLLILLGVWAVRYNKPTIASVESPPEEHIYATWDTMEFDKCVAAWLIVRFIEEDAKFVFYPQGTEIKQGIVFDIPGAAWSRKHRKCTSDCILESLNINDSAVQEIVAMAHNVELNFWQLDRFPQAQKCFGDIRQIIEAVPERQQCYQETRAYFDVLHNRLRQQSGRSDEQ